MSIWSHTRRMSRWIYILALLIGAYHVSLTRDKLKTKVMPRSPAKAFLSSLLQLMWHLIMVWLKWRFMARVKLHYHLARDIRVNEPAMRYQPLICVKVLGLKLLKNWLGKEYEGTRWLQFMVHVRNDYSMKLTFCGCLNSSNRLNCFIGSEIELVYLN